MTLYSQHIACLLKRYRTAMDAFKVDTLILSSGYKTYYFQDDISHSFRPYSGAQQWLPFNLTSDIHIIIPATGQPILLWPIIDDFWHAKSVFPKGEWQDFWSVIDHPKGSNISQYIKGKCAWLGPKQNDLELTKQFISCDEHRQLETYLNYDKAYKTEFEIEAIRRANSFAAAGHKAAEQAFLEDKCELAIYHDYLMASHQESPQEPYPGIVALNENTAVLHYEKKSRYHDNNNRSFLIDAGANVHGYASDITRTYTKEDGLFKELILNMDELQQNICAKAVAEKEFRQLHRDAQLGIAQILQNHKICSLNPEAQLEKGVIQTFFPHGLGHFLGLQVHDVGGHQVDHQGHLQRPSASSPSLRLTRTLEESMVITIEPGLYFIPMLLAKMQHEIPQHGCDFALIESLLSYGGIRIEDNLAIGKESSRNLTREAFAE